MHIDSRAGSIAIIAIGAIFFADGCASYHPAPLHPEQSERAFNGRTLGDPELQKLADTRPAVARNSSTAQPGEAFAFSWNLISLTRAAIYLHPEMAVARAHLHAIHAGQSTAAEMPNPSIALAPEYATNPGGITPWIWGFSLDIPIETAGKRDIRIAQADALTNAAQYELAETAWRVRARVRDSLAEFVLATREAKLWDGEVEARTTYLHILEARLQAGEVARTDVDLGRIDLLTARQSRLTVYGRSADARTRLAAAIGLTSSGLRDATITWPDLDDFTRLDDAEARQLQAAGLLNRLDIRRSLAEYAAAEAALHLEIAKQYPDLHLTPGYLFDQAVNKIQLGLTLAIPILNQNGGAIGEAEAHRAEAGQKFLSLQAQAIGDTESAVARYRSAMAELEEADLQIRLIDAQLTAVQRGLAAGEQDRLAVFGLEVQNDVAQRLHLDAIRKAQSARAAIEDAIQRPMTISRDSKPQTQPAPASRPSDAQKDVAP
jgi:outer membrane protein TolC